MSSLAKRHVYAARQQLSDAENKQLSLHTRMTCAYNTLAHAGMAILCARGEPPAFDEWEQDAVNALATLGAREIEAVREWASRRYDAPGRLLATSVEEGVKVAREALKVAQCTLELLPPG